MKTTPEFSIRGIQDQLEVFEDRLTITPKGVRGFLNKGIKGTKEIPFRSITAIQIKDAGSILSGYIQFSILGGNESKAGLLAAASDENTFMFSNTGNNEEIHAIKRFIEFKIKVANTPEQNLSKTSIPDEIRKLADLHSQGILSEEEFTAAKASLLKQLIVN